jgi:hypothetical protein
MIVALKHPLDIVADRPSPMRDLLLNSYFLTTEIADRPTGHLVDLPYFCELRARCGHGRAPSEVNAWRCSPPLPNTLRARRLSAAIKLRRAPIANTAATFFTLRAWGAGYFAGLHRGLVRVAGGKRRADHVGWCRLVDDARDGFGRSRAIVKPHRREVRRRMAHYQDRQS